MGFTRLPCGSRASASTWCRGAGRCRNGPAPGLLSGLAFFQSGGVTRGLEWFGSGHQEIRRWSTMLGLTCRCS